MSAVELAAEVACHHLREIQRLKAALVLERDKTKKYRDRVTLTPADVEAAGVTWPVVQAWAKTQPASLTRSHSFDTPDWYAADQDVNEGRQTVRLIIATINLAATLAEAAGRDVCPLDVLEEMAALKESTCPTDA